MLLIQSLGLKDELPKPGYNTKGGSVFGNYVKARRDQFFLLEEGNIQYETPSSASVEVNSLIWCSNLHFTSNSNGTYSRGIGYTAQCIKSFLGDTKSKFDTLGGQLPSTINADYLEYQIIQEGAAIEGVDNALGSVDINNHQIKTIRICKRISEQQS